ncbi:ATP-dependent DNA helicase DinG [Brevibacillus sp. FSL K6-0770]|uniref:3'-5' exonuclease DinG n=1 Tax=Brevibacillus parabrevis TaxID=54914 RepID=A0A4Y3PQZ1_BREPA|nr:MULTISPECIES: ATP-dependent DNA helicase DinG [Brevibacillus]NRQ52293.1 ATP-dependent DNA helicase DinG [Brevibacillus sp. HD1.4A]RNB96254.1 ATP-dependent helicase DinG [Brevibacillus parabrevis]GEB32761.1 ATP-dependent helicase DinG [Brevibacillus parabrevis]HBZ84027.1 ATP-dependent helicase DinG [Brevibacillus sp.]
MNRLLVVDFETTGSHPRQGDSIIQIGAVAIDDGQITECFSTLIHPGQDIPPFITQLTGITNEMVADAPTLEEVFPTFLRLLDGRAFVAHNASFDLQFLQEALLSQGYYAFDGYVLDTVELSRLLLPMQNSYRLGELASELAIEHDNPHQADSDALATAQLFLHLLDILQQLPLVTIQRLQMLVSSFRSDIATLLRQMEMEKLAELPQLGDEPARQASPLWDIYRQLALKKREEKLKASFQRPQTERSYGKAFSEQLEEMLNEKGQMHASMSGYQRREAQEAMMHAVFDAMQEGTHLLVEAGTGTGKSLAYLLPGIIWAYQNQQQLVVSTNTIQLQEQLFHKEIATLQQTLPFAFTASTLKGRGNYLCLRKFEMALEEPVEGSNQEMRLAKGQLLTWLTQTETGDVEELSLPPSGQLFWQQVKSDTSSCLNRACPWFSRCYYFQAKDRAKEADVLIVNHALFISDLQAENRILPPYEVAILDEAHHLEDAATQHLGKQLTTTQVMFLLDRASVEEGGAIARFAEEMQSWQPSVQEELNTVLLECKKLSASLRDKAQQWTQFLYAWASERAEETTDAGRETVRYRVASFTGKQEKIRKVTKKLIDAMTDFASRLEQMLKLVPVPQEEKPPFLIRSLQTDLFGLVKEWQNVMELLHFFLQEQDPNYVYWMEVESRTARKQVHLSAALLDVADSLAEPLFSQKRSLIMTSATLTVKNSFSYVMSRFGLDKLPAERVRTLSLPSPFHYEEQGLLLIPSDFPAPGKENDQTYLEAIIQGCVDVVVASKGRTLILFTSHSMLRLVYQAMKERLAGEPEPYTLFGHGIDSNNRSKLVSLFRSMERSVLLGTSSFWEGVDIQGEWLSSLVIIKLPFTPPNHPVYQGRAEALKADGKNAFMSLALPQAVILFKQGVGRLIRHHLDRGVVVVFDTRVVESRYGRSFLQSLPPFQVETGSWPTLRERIEPFLRMQSLPDS